MCIRCTSIAASVNADDERRNFIGPPHYFPTVLRIFGGHMFDQFPHSFVVERRTSVHYLGGLKMSRKVIIGASVCKIMDVHEGHAHRTAL